jgi:hypothetical protein
MPKNTPLKITLYDPETYEVIKEFTQMFVPWKMFKAAIHISKSLGDIDFSNSANIPEETYDEITTFIVEVFSNRFTAEELGNGAEFNELLPVINQIISKAKNLGNPTPPGK